MRLLARLMLYRVYFSDSFLKYLNLMVPLAKKKSDSECVKPT
jgi:hypothetical protein